MMFTRLRWTAALCAVLSCFVGMSASADSYNTTLNYESTPNNLQGASVTYVDSPNWECSNYDNAEIPLQADHWDGVQDGWMILCAQAIVYHGWAGVQGYITNPASQKSLAGSSMSFSSSYAGVPYLISTPATGYWLAEGEHYAATTSEYCGLEYTLYPFFDPYAPSLAPGTCTGSGPPGSGWNIGQSSDGAYAP